MKKGSGRGRYARGELEGGGEQETRLLFRWDRGYVGSEKATQGGGSRLLRDLRLPTDMESFHTARHKCVLM